MGDDRPPSTRFDAFYESFAVGERWRHRRSRTVLQADNAFLSLLTINTSQSHFNEEFAGEYMHGAFDRLLVSAPVVLAVAVGLTSYDLGRQWVDDVHYRELRMPSPVFAGDTISAASRIVSLADGGDPESGVVTYQITTVNSSGTVVLEVERAMRVRRRRHPSRPTGRCNA